MAIFTNQCAEDIAADCKYAGFINHKVADGTVVRSKDRNAGIEVLDGKPLPLQLPEEAFCAGKSHTCHIDISSQGGHVSGFPGDAAQPGDKLRRISYSGGWSRLSGNGGHVGIGH